MILTEHRVKMRARLIDALKRELAEYDRVIEVESLRLDDLHEQRNLLRARLERAENGGERPC